VLEIVQISLHFQAIKPLFIVTRVCYDDPSLYCAFRSSQQLPHKTPMHQGQTICPVILHL